MKVLFFNDSNKLWCIGDCEPYNLNGMNGQLQCKIFNIVPNKVHNGNEVMFLQCYIISKSQLDTENYIVIPENIADILFLNN